MTTQAFRIPAVLAGAAYALSGAAVLGHQLPDSNWGTRGAVIDAAGAAAFALTAVALAGLSRIIGGGRVARRAAGVAQAGLAGMTVESIASLVHGGNTLGGLFFGGLLVALGGLAAFAVAGLRAGRLRWAAPLPVLGLLVGIAGGDHGGFLATGVTWLVLGLATATDRLAPVPA